MDLRLSIDPAKSSGIFAGATGEVEIAAPAYRVAGYLVVTTLHGEVRMNFLEKGGRGVLNTDLWIDGANSTGLYHNARGELKFAMALTPPNFGKGTYSGTIWLKQEPPSTETTTNDSADGSASSSRP